MTTLEWKTVLVPVDFSDETGRALDVGRMMVAQSGTLHVVHVLPTPPVGTVPPGTTGQERMRNELPHLQQFLNQANVTGVKTHVREGDPGHEIVNLAGELRADLIVMPSHGRTGLAHVLIGSVTERVARLSHCPVLVLRK